MDSEFGNSWSVVRLTDERTGEAWIGVDFPTAMHGRKFGVLDNDLGESPEKARLVLKRKGAHLTGTKNDQVEYLRKLLRGLAKSPTMVLACKPGFREKGFVLAGRMLGMARDQYRWRSSGAGERELGSATGTKAGWDATVGRIALHSSYLTLAIAIPLAACLTSYYRRMRANAPISETATFNFSGDSGTGRTTVSKACAGVFGPPEPLHKWDFSRRGLEEICESRNDLVVVLDDTEKMGEHMNPKTAIRMVTQIIPDGTSKIISAAAKKNDLPDLRWNVFAVSSSPKTLDQLAKEYHWTRSRGEQVRMIDNPVPDPQHAGIFDNLNGSALDQIRQGKQLIAELEVGVAEHFGVVFPEWVDYLLAEDRTSELTALVDLFVSKLAPGGDGWTERFARKWGLIYAAAELARRAGIVPWPERWTGRAIARCYRRAMGAIQSNYDQAVEKVRLLARSVGDERRFPHVSLTTSRPVRFQSSMMGIKTRLNEQAIYAMREDEFRAFAGSGAIAKEMIGILRQHGAVVASQGHACTKQLHLRAEIKGKIINKPRFLVVDAMALVTLAKA